MCCQTEEIIGKKIITNVQVNKITNTPNRSLLNSMLELQIYLHWLIFLEMPFAYFQKTINPSFLNLLQE